MDPMWVCSFFSGLAAVGTVIAGVKGSAPAAWGGAIVTVMFSASTFYFI